MYQSGNLFYDMTCLNFLPVENPEKLKHEYLKPNVGENDSLNLTFAFLSYYNKFVDTLMGIKR